MKPDAHAARYYEFDGESIVLRFVATFPEFLPKFEEHLAQFDELLFHPFMFEVIETLGLGLSPPNPDRLNAILTFFETEATASDSARNEIAVAFEHHPPCDEALTARLTFGVADTVYPIRTSGT